MKVILSKDLNDIYIMRIDILDELKVVVKLYDESHVLLYLFHLHDYDDFLRAM